MPVVGRPPFGMVVNQMMRIGAASLRGTGGRRTQETDTVDGAQPQKKKE